MTFLSFFFFFFFCGWVGGGWIIDLFYWWEAGVGVWEGGGDRKEGKGLGCGLLCWRVKSTLFKPLLSGSGGGASIAIP